MSSINIVEEEYDCVCEMCQKTNLYYDDGRFFGKDHDIFYCHDCADLWEGKKDSVHGFYSRIRKEWIAYADVESIVDGDVIDATSYTGGKSDQYRWFNIRVWGVTKCYLKVTIDGVMCGKISKKRLGDIIHTKVRNSW